MPIKPKKQAMTIDAAETLAIRALSFLAEDAGRLSRFIALTGLDIADLKAHPPSTNVLAAILDHLMTDEPLLLVFSSEVKVPPEEIGTALRVLSSSCGHAHE
jgi:hypothetical protein